MRIRYSWAVALGLFALPASLCFHSYAKQEAMPLPVAHVRPIAPAALAPADPRTVRLSRFLSHLHCPVSELASDFVKAADDNHLDWRLLPSISVIESGGGKAYRNNNIFGWNNGSQVFASIRSSIGEIAYKLGRSPLYRNRNVAEKLYVYNPDTEYVQNVLTVMDRISPAPELRTIRRTFEAASSYPLEQN